MALAVLSGAASCGGTPPATTASRATSSPRKSGALVARITPSRLVPEVESAAHEDDPLATAPRRLLVNGIRIALQPDGRVERADQRFDSGAVRWLSMPDRLGGGFLFYQADSQGTRLWRAAGWTDSLQPLARLAAAADEVLVGLDRLYVRVESSNRLLGLDAETGRIAPLGGLPAAPSYGAMSFADGWRGVVEADLRGPMATFDAGATWHRLPIAERLLGAGVEQGDPALYVADGHYRVSLTGQVQFVGQTVAEAEEAQTLVGSEGAVSSLVPSAQAPLGRQPLRTIVLSGIPDDPSTAVVARRGALVRVRLPEGSVLELARGAFEERGAECTGARVGAGYGFICGEPEGPTVIYAFTPPLRLREVARFAGPRFVSPGNTGALVVRGGCAENVGAGAEGVRTYCIVGIDGGRREVGVRGDLGAERVVALKDGRVVVLVPPRSGAPGRLTTIDGSAIATVKLSFPDGPAKSVRLAKRGLWLDGFQQRGADAVAGWVEAGGPVLGVTVGLDGAVTLGKVVEGAGHALLSGSFALVTAQADVARESTDGGRTWLEIELPSLPESARDPRSRGCSPLGCALRGWVRVGWGEPAREDDLELAAAPEPTFARPASQRAVRARCQVVGLAGHGAPSAARPESSQVRGDWRGLGGKGPPRLAKGDLGAAKGTSSYDPVPAHVYVWGPKGADWSRAGWWMARFRDRFDPAGHVVSSAATRSPWGDQAAASEAIGARSRGGYWRWSARLEPSGRAALLSACRGSKCRLYAVTEGRPILPLSDEAARSDSFRTPLPQGVARLGESWFFLVDPGADELELWRAELGVARPLMTYPRLHRRRYGAPAQPRLVRRAVSRGLGLLMTVPSDPSEGGRAATWVVLPVDPATGKLGEPVPLGPADLGGQLPELCSTERDGWLLDGPLDTSVVLELTGGRRYLDSVEFRLRLAPDHRCVEAIAARTGKALPVAEGRARRRGGQASGKPVPGAAAVPVAVRLQNSGATWELGCTGTERREPSRLDQLLGNP